MSTRNQPRISTAWKRLAAYIVIVSLLLNGAPARGARQVAPLEQSTGDGLFTLIWSSAEIENNQGIAWGDADGDGDLDLAVAVYNVGLNLYRNEDGVLASSSSTNLASIGEGAINDIAWGDWDGDGDLDLAVTGFLGPSVYRNETVLDGEIRLEEAWTGPEFVSFSVAWGDVNGDGRLDLAVGNWSGPSQVFLNTGGMLGAAAAWFSPPDLSTRSIAWAEVTGDSNLDLVIGNHGQSNQVYRNAGADPVTGALRLELFWSSVETDNTQSIALGDVDGDHNIDMVVGNTDWQGCRLYLNNGTGTFTLSTWNPGAGVSTVDVALGDVDGDGDLDLLAGNNGKSNILYRNDGPENLVQAWSDGEEEYTQGVALGDVDGDGDLDLAVANNGGIVKQHIRVYRNDGRMLAKSAAWSAASGATAVSWGDVDGDHTLDLAVGYSNLGVGNTLPGPNHLYRTNPGTGLPTLEPTWSSSDSDFTQSIAWGDVDGDGDLDLAVGNTGDMGAGISAAPNKIYLNQEGILNPIAAWSSPETDMTNSIAWGDADGDGDLDLAVGNGGYSTSRVPREPDRVYRNDGPDPLTKNPRLVEAWFDTEMVFDSLSLLTNSVAWGDVDGDGDLDLAVGYGSNFNFHRTFPPNHLYRNDGPDPATGSFRLTLAQEFSPEVDTQSLAWGDYDGDGDMDLAVGNYGDSNQLFRNDGGVLVDSGWLPVDSGEATSVAWGDVDGDGDLDLVIGYRDHASRVFRNDHGALTPRPVSSMENYSTRSVALGDVNGDGRLDMAVGAMGAAGQATYVYLNAYGVSELPGALPTISIQSPGSSSGGYAEAHIFNQATIPVEYTLSGPVRRISAQYSLNCGGKWQEAKAASGTLLENLLAGSHTFNWDIYGSGFFGKSDCVVVRLILYPHLGSPANGTPGPYLYGSRAAQSLPFRARGIQVLVRKPGGAPAENARVFRFTGDPAFHPKALSDLSGEAYRTDALGYLRGSGALRDGEWLAAFVPQPAPAGSPCEGGKCEVNLSNFNPNGSSGLVPVNISLGTQTITVSNAYPLVLFNLTVSLQWDARADDTFLADLEIALQRASDLLYDVSNGQAALGEVTVYQNREHWLDADIVVYAQNGIRPRATMGGMVENELDDVGYDANGSAKTIQSAYTPGQIRMGPNWDPFGTSLAELKQDWLRALAHELSHYLLFLPDNYIGVENNTPITIDCKGSFMTSTYDSAYSEFLNRSQWDADGDCQKTMAQNTTRRADWETIRKFYPALFAPSAILDGPVEVPLYVLEVAFPDPQDDLGHPLPLPMPGMFFDVRYDETLQSVPGAQVYLFKTRATPDLSDDSAILLGGTTGAGDTIKVRGAEIGDRVCLYGPVSSQTGSGWWGCNVLDDSADRSIGVQVVPDWQPDVTVEPLVKTDPVTHEPLLVTQYQVTAVFAQALPAGQALSAQIFPAYGGENGAESAAVSALMTASADRKRFSVTLTLDHASYEGIGRVWRHAPGSPLVPQAEMITPFFLSPPWGPNQKGATMGGDKRAWGANNRALGAPVASGDGQVSIFNLEDIFAETGTVSLQAIPGASLPGLPVWLKAVGQGYRFIPDPAQRYPRVIGFDYLQRDVPPGYEDTLTMYYQADGGTEWVRLESSKLDTQYNRATAVMPADAGDGKGIYALVATVKMPRLVQGWNLFGYPLLASRGVEEALASVLDDLSLAAGYADGGWRFYSPEVLGSPYAGLVNDLDVLDFGRIYWLYALREVTPYIGVPDQSTPLGGVPYEPGSPALLYGPVKGAAAGMAVEARVAGVLCGQGKVVMVNNAPAYRLLVSAGAANGCGSMGRSVQVLVNKQARGYIDWDNTRATYFPLDTSRVVYPERLFMPSLRK